MASLEPDHDVFISFSSLDSDKAEAVCERLEAEGSRCWISLRDVKPGQNYQAAIVQAIKRAKIMVLNNPEGPPGRVAGATLRPVDDAGRLDVMLQQLGIGHERLRFACLQPPIVCELVW